MVNQNMVKGALAVVVLSAIVLMGIAVVEGFSKEFRDDTGTVNMSMTLGLINVSTLIGTADQYPYVETLTSCENDTGEYLQAGNFTLTIGTSGNNGFLTLVDSADDSATDWEGTTVECLGNYLADSALQTEADKFNTGLGIFGSFIGVVVLAVLGMFIMNMFRRKKD